MTGIGSSFEKDRVTTEGASSQKTRGTRHPDFSTILVETQSPLKPKGETKASPTEPARTQPVEASSSDRPAKHSAPSRLAGARADGAAHVRASLASPSVARRPLAKTTLSGRKPNPETSRPSPARHDGSAQSGCPIIADAKATMLPVQPRTIQLAGAGAPDRAERTSSVREQSDATTQRATISHPDPSGTLLDPGASSQALPGRAEPPLTSMNLEPPSFQDMTTVPPSPKTPSPIGVTKPAELSQENGAADGQLAISLGGAIKISRADPGAPDRSGDMSVRLSLPHLGTIQVHAHRDSGSVMTITISADRQETLRSMVTDQAQLRAVLHESGLAEGTREIEYALLPTTIEQDGRSSSPFSPEGGGERRERSEAPDGYLSLSPRQDEDTGLIAPSGIAILSALHVVAKSINITA